MHLEVKNVQRLDHLGIAKCVDSNADAYEQDEELYLVTEFIPGPSLEIYRQTGPIALSTAVTLIGTLLDAVAYCHRANVIHRDIKPDNIVLRDGRPETPVLIDFGLSFNRETHPEGFETNPGHQLGNRFFILPDLSIYAADKRDPVTDVTFCVGIFFYILTGHHPDALVDDTGKMPHERDYAQGLWKEFPAHTEGLRRVFDVGFSLQRAKRWQSAESLKKATDALLSERLKAQPFEQGLAALRMSILETPSHKLDEKSAQLFAALENAVAIIIHKLTSFMTGVAHVQVISGGNLPDNTKGSTGFQLVGHWNSNRRVAGLLFLVIEKHEMILIGRISDYSQPTTLQTSETKLLQTAMFDPAAEQLMREQIEDFSFRVCEIWKG